MGMEESLLILHLLRRHVDLLKQETKKVQPIEACALLFGKLSNGEAVAEKIVFAPNKLQSTVRFEIDPETVATAFAEAEKKGLDFVGFFHSHPAPAAPSSIDLEGMRLWGDVIWLILSSTDSKLSAYQLTDDMVKEATIRIE